MTATRLHIDVTSCWERKGRPVGISRVVTELAHAVRQLSDLNQAWRYDRRAKIMRPVTWKEFDSLAEDISRPTRLRRAARAVISRLPLARWAHEMSTTAWARLRRTWGSRRSFPSLGENDRFIFGDWISDPDRIAVYGAMMRAGEVSAVLYCHDVIPLLFGNLVEPGIAIGFEAALSIFLGPRSRLICNSVNTRNDLERLWSEGYLAHDALVLTPGSDLKKNELNAIAHGLGLDLDPGYILYVSTIEVRKNHRVLIEAYVNLIAGGAVDLPPLIFVGTRGWMVDDLLEEIESGYAAGGRIRLLDQVSDAGLCWLYRNASFTVYPSFYEGWGIPVSEALTFGKFCLCSDRGALPEAGAGFVELLDPADSDLWARRIRHFLDRPEELRARELAIRAGYRPRLWSDFREEAAAALASV